MSTLTPSMTLTTLERTQVKPEASTGIGSPRIVESIAPGESVRSTAKKAMDLFGSAFGLFLLTPVLIVVALLVKLESRGPVLFFQKRKGLHGQDFWCVKFRTMVSDAEQRLEDLEARNESAGGVLFKIKDDPRITKLGRFLRRTSLDELPQLWNVLAGEMSLVGPRPLQLRDSEKLAELDPEAYARRLSVVPGVTGPWQVGGRSNMDSEGMLELDLNYVENWSIAADLEILARTVIVVLACRGAC